MFLADNGIIPPKEWIHKPNIKDNENNYTVAILLAHNGIIPPNCWVY